MREIYILILKSVRRDLWRIIGGMTIENVTRPRVYFPLIILCLFLFIPPFLSRYYLHILILIFMFAAGAEAWNIIGGYGGQLSLGHAAFFGLGAYTSTMLYYYFQISPWIGMILGAVVALLVSLFTGSLCFRLRGPYFVIATIALAEVLRFLFLNQRWVTLGATGMNVQYRGHDPLYFQFAGKLPYYYIALVMTLMVIYVTYKIENSRLGHYLVALGQNQDAAEAVGVNSVQVKQVALSTSAFFTAVTGTFYAQYTYFIDPDSVFGLSLSIELALFAIVGGVGTLWGPIIGAFILRIFSEYTSATFGAGLTGLQLVIYGGLLMAMVLAKPEGLATVFAKGYRWAEAVLPGGANTGEIGVKP